MLLGLPSKPRACIELGPDPSRSFFVLPIRVITVSEAPEIKLVLSSLLMRTWGAAPNKAPWIAAHLEFTVAWTRI